MKDFPQLNRHDHIEVSWVDIFEDGTGNPEKAALYRRKTVGLFWSQREDDGIPVLITTTTKDHDGEPDQQGFCIYPLSVVTEIRIIKRARKHRSKKP